MISSEPISGAPIAAYNHNNASSVTPKINPFNGLIISGAAPVMAVNAMIAAR